MWLLAQHHNLKWPQLLPSLMFIPVPWLWLDELSLSGKCFFMFSTCISVQPLQWTVKFVCVCFWLYPRTLSHFLTTSHVGSSEQLSVSPRVRDQSEAPISPTTTTVDAAGQREGSGLTSCHTDPASHGQNPGPWATASHCVSFQPSRSHGATAERTTRGGNQGGHRERKKEHPEAEGSLCDVNIDPYCWKPFCCCMGVCY